MFGIGIKETKGRHCVSINGNPAFFNWKKQKPTTKKGSSWYKVSAEHTNKPYMPPKEAAIFLALEVNDGFVQVETLLLTIYGYQDYYKNRSFDVIYAGLKKKLEGLYSFTRKGKAIQMKSIHG